METDCIDLTKDDDDGNFRFTENYSSADERANSEPFLSETNFQPNYGSLCPNHYSFAMIPRTCFVCHCDVTIPIPHPGPAHHLWRPFDDESDEIRSPKKSRNPWGSMSYSDLITKAILSSPNKRLMLTQIYDWFVANVPYFSDKGDTNSSIGWKNSIRHNLSLHKRFVRLDSNGGVKSSYWTVNPNEAKTKKKRQSKSSTSTDQSGE